jgi:hypothetical protein
MDITMGKPPQSNETLILSITNQFEVGLTTLKEILPKLEKVKGSTIPSNMNDKQLLTAWDNLNVPDKTTFDAMLSTLRPENKIKIIKYIAVTDLSLEKGFIMGGDGELVTTSEGDIEEVPREEKKVFFNLNFIGSLMSLLLGIYIMYLVADTLQGLNETYDLNVTSIKLFTDFKGTIEYIPIAVLKVVATDGLAEMRHRIMRGCTSITGNTATTMLYSFFQSSDSATCIQEQTVEGIRTVANISASEVTTALKMTWRLTAMGGALITGSVGNMGRLLLDKNKSPLAITNGDDTITTTGGKRKSKRKTRKSKKTRKGKKGKKGRKSRRKH